MKVYIPSCYASWLQTTPPEGQIMLVALVTNFAYIYGPETYLEFENSDLDIVNHTGRRGFNYTEIKSLKTLGILDVAKGVDMKTTIRLAKDKVHGLDRRNLYTDVIGIDLSLEGTLIWTYLMGRLANVDEEVEVSTIAKIREYANSAKNLMYRNKEKTCVTHIIPLIYRQQLGYNFENVIEAQPIKNQRNDIPTDDMKQYQRTYYELKRNQVLEQKRLKYLEKKAKKDGRH